MIANIWRNTMSGTKINSPEQLHSIAMTLVNGFLPEVADPGRERMAVLMTAIGFVLLNDFDPEERQEAGRTALEHITEMLEIINEEDPVVE
jgi:hypothetical protein